ncbi:MAG: fatty acid cis/trans isomerase [Thiohalomonadales bacterium]
MSAQEKLYGPASPQNRVLTLTEIKQEAYISFSKQVQPILDKRCVVCHACNDAPCQLNLTSIEGLDRGASTTPVYNGARFFQQNPTRLGIDAQSTREWRDKKFHTVLNERRQEKQINLDNSLLYRMLKLKQDNPLPTDGRLSADYAIGVDLKKEESFIHKQTCSTMEKFSNFERAHPKWGMPFALPGLSPQEFEIIETWLAQGGRVEPATELPHNIKNKVAKWEDFLNGSSNKERLMSRYLYEHLFAGHIYFDKLSNSEFFMLVRSRTPPGKKIEIIPTIRPYDDPGVTNFYYRLQYYDRSIVDKTHMPYAFNDQRMARYTSLFLEPSYEVDELPAYEKDVAANPFITFIDIPSINRYKFLLDEAHFFISGFIKGPVCRGSIALSVIDDHFWVMFTDPKKSYISRDSKFLASIVDNLRMPSEKENSAWLFSVWSTYRSKVVEYSKKRVEYLHERYPEVNLGVSIEQIWNGDQVNRNAALTVYRHYDSATVLKGFVGEIPKTSWVIDYPVFERIHYLLVAGFDVYGTAGHQLSTRLYMDFLRIEAELEFLRYIPVAERIKMHRFWYRNTKDTEKILKLVRDIGELREPAIVYKTDNVKDEFFIKVSKHMGGAQQQDDHINLCAELVDLCKSEGLKKSATRTEKILRKLANISGEITWIFPNVMFLRVKVDGSLDNDQVYSIIRNKAYLNTSSLSVAKVYVKKENTLDVVKGFAGAYPNFFLEVDYSELEDFVEQFAQIDSPERYEPLIQQYGIRRTNPDFWKSADWFFEKYKHDNPVSAGLFDLARYKNR